jgi:hypothetical protein
MFLNCAVDPPITMYSMFWRLTPVLLGAEKPALTVRLFPMMYTPTPCALCCATPAPTRYPTLPAGPKVEWWYGSSDWQKKKAHCKNAALLHCDYRTARTHLVEEDLAALPIPLDQVVELQARAEFRPSFYYYSLA